MTKVFNHLLTVDSTNKSIVCIRIKSFGFFQCMVFAGPSILSVMEFAQLETVTLGEEKVPYARLQLPGDTPVRFECA